MAAKHWFIELLDRLPGWPSERQWVTAGLFGFAGVLLQMAFVQPTLWDIKLFEIIIQAVILTGLLNMVTAFHFSANKGDEKRSENTAKAFDAITATAQAGTGTTDPAAIREGDEITLEKK